MRPVRAWLIDVAISLPICLIAAGLLSPHLGFWRSFLIITPTSMLVIMYVDHRWPHRGERRP